MSWAQVPIGALYERIERRGRADLSLLSVYRDLGVVPREGRDDNNNRPSDDLEAYKVVQPGDLVVNKMKTWQGSLGVSAYEGIVSPAYFVARPRNHFERRFIHHLLRSQPLIARYAALSKGIRPSQWDLPWDEFKSIKVSLPPLAEQRAIADYLDAETARIDALITKKQQLLHLLDERLIAELQAMVTGLDRQGDRWQTGPSWIGTVPSHWIPMKISWHKFTGSGTTPGGDAGTADDSGTIPWVTTTELRETIINRTTKNLTAQTFANHSALQLFPVGTVLVAMYGATVGRLGILGIPASTNQACCAIYGDGNLDQMFLYWWLRAFRSNLLDLAYGAGQPNINQDTIRSLRVPAPSKTEQSEIARACGTIAETQEHARECLTKQLKLLTERRSTIVTMAVTGLEP